jgi:hypothetical protein
VSSSTKASPVTEPSDIHQPGRVNLALKEGDGEGVIMPHGLEPVDISRVKEVVMGTDQRPGVICICWSMLAYCSRRLGASISPEPSWLRGGPDSGKAPVFGLMAANMVDSAFRVGIRSFVETNWVGTAMPISPGHTALIHVFNTHD